MNDKIKKGIEGLLEKFHFVKWDRYVASDNEITIYGWINRNKDSYKDFITLYFVNSILDSYITSSTKYSLAIYKMINKGKGGGHINCKRVELAFDIDNSIKLNDRLNNNIRVR